MNLNECTLGDLVTCSPRELKKIRQFIVFSITLEIRLGVIYSTDFWDVSSLLT